MEARNRFGELLDVVFYKGAQFQISRKRKALGWLVGDPFMKSMTKLIDYIMEHEPTLADTIAINLDEQLQSVLERGKKEVKAGKTVPIETILDD